MKTIKKVTLGTLKVMAAILGCVLMPVLIWVALGFAVQQKRYQQKPVQEQVPSFREVIADTGDKK